MSGPPFGDRHYQLAQFHCHWGSHCNSGSEHTINGRSYSAEVSFSHVNLRDKHGLKVLQTFEHRFILSIGTAPTSTPSRRPLDMQMDWPFWLFSCKLSKANKTAIDIWSEFQASCVVFERLEQAQMFHSDSISSDSFQVSSISHQLIQAQIKAY